MNGGNSGNGIVFELTPVSGTWQETIVHSFAGGYDGANPHDDTLLLDSKGYIYGTCKKGGTIGWGVAFQMKPASGKWIENVLYDFSGGNDGLEPVGGLTDWNGSLYGTTFGGGVDFAGVVYQLSR